jgi:hypothetical protein
LSTYSTDEIRRRAHAQAGYVDWEDRGSGGTAFAGVLPLMVGALTVIGGIAAIQVASGVGIFTRNQLARWIGIVVLTFGAIAELLMMPASGHCRRLLGRPESDRTRGRQPDVVAAAPEIMLAMGLAIDGRAAGVKASAGI